MTRFIHPELPPAARKPCNRAASLPDRRLTEAEATSAWARDRASLAECEQRRAAAVAAIDAQKGS